MQMSVPFRLHPRPARSGRSRRATAGGRGWRVLSAISLVLAVLLYGVAPMATLWDAAEGVRTGNIAALRGVLDWNSVRGGLKEDLVSAPATAQPAEDELPAFGSSFATTVVSHAIDTEVTPEKLAVLLSASGGTTTGGGWRAAIGRLVSLRFASPSRFDAAIRLGGPDAAPVLLSLRLVKWRWRITRIHLPADVPLPARTDRA